MHRAIQVATIPPQTVSGCDILLLRLGLTCVADGETIHISSLALLKMLKHGRAGVPMEVMGLCLGEFVDDTTIHVTDVFAMPQSGTTVSVESVDHVFQTKMLSMLKQTGRSEMVVGWYHSHPGFGCWLSSVDINTQQSFEQLNPRAVAIVVDPIQSVKGKVVADAFRLIDAQNALLGHESRQSTSNVGQLIKPSIQGLIHGVGRHYYSLAIQYRKSKAEERMLSSLSGKAWTKGLELEQADTFRKNNEGAVDKFKSLADQYGKSVAEELTLTPEQLATRHVGKQDPKRVRRCFLGYDSTNHPHHSTSKSTSQSRSRPRQCRCWAWVCLRACRVL